MLPVNSAKIPAITCWVDAKEETTLHIELRKSSKSINHTPDVTLETKRIQLSSGRNEITVDWSTSFDEAGYAFVCFMKNEKVSLQYSETRITGLVSVFNATNPAVSNYGKQEPAEDIGVDTFEFWCPQRRPEGRNVAMKFEQRLEVFGTENLINGFHRPVSQPNAWVAELDDKNPLLTISWNKPTSISKVEFVFDSDYDHPMENVIFVHPETAMPFCVQKVTITNCNDEVVGTISDNHQSRRSLTFQKPVITQHLKIRLSGSNANVPVSLIDVRCYE